MKKWGECLCEGPEKMTINDHLKGGIGPQKVG
jgi:hypothetical protein